MIDRETPFGWCCILEGIAYPSTVVPARYGGCYEGGSWLAFPCNPDRMPDGWDGGDVECAGFFAEHRSAPIGRGVSPDAAHDDLVRRLRQYAPTPQAENEPVLWQRWAKASIGWYKSGKPQRTKPSYVPASWRVLPSGVHPDDEPAPTESEEVRDGE